MTQRPPGLARRASMTPLRPRSMLFTLYGDYAFPQGRDVPLGGLVEIGRELGLSEVAVRSAVARLAREGWLVSRRDGPRSRYGLSEAGRRLIEEGTARIYRPRAKPWDGVWCLLQYSIPESKRADRDRIRKRLAWLGFGALGGGVYASPRDVSGQALGLLDEHGLGQYGRVFSARYDGPGGDARLVAECWDLRAIAQGYEAFVKHYAPLDRGPGGGRGASDADAFVVRFALTHDFRRFPFTDPDLPDALLPRSWPGRRARTLFETRHRAMTAGANRFFAKIAGDV